MFLNGPTIATAIFSIVGVIFACPVLIRGFKRRGTGVKYEKDFLIQRAPQYASLINLFCVIVSFCTFNHIGKKFSADFVLSLVNVLPHGPAMAISCLGLAIQVSGFIFMVGGWYNLGKYFSTDAEILEEQGVKTTGLFGLVMHPAYSGITQTLLGFSLTALSPLSIGLNLFLVAPLWLNRARYEEKLLLESLGDAYRDYAVQMKWRRVVPLCLPFGF
jgi:protein-S-isoprenylcysteine O-methyltransferase Ste14